MKRFVSSLFVLVFALGCSSHKQTAASGQKQSPVKGTKKVEKVEKAKKTAKEKKEGTVMKENVKENKVKAVSGPLPLEEVLKHVKGQGEYLVAQIVTTKGKFVCNLFYKKTPVTVANFVGLAIGVQPYRDPRTGEWKTGKFYDGIVFHRVIPNFMIQGGDPLGRGTGGPGYKFKDEFVKDLLFDRPGRLAMANAGPGTNGSQFFITEKPTPWLNHHHTIFGQCWPVSLVKKIARAGNGNTKIVTIIVEKMNPDAFEKLKASVVNNTSSNQGKK